MEEDKLIDFLYKTLLPEAEKFDEGFKANRADNRKFYKGDQWRRRQPSYKSKKVTNFSSLIIRDEVAILTDNIPEANIRPVDFKTDPEKALLMKKLVNRILYQNNFNELMYKTVKKSDIEGLAYLYPYWDSKKEDVAICCESADSVSIDPSGEQNWFRISRKVTMAEIYRLYPEKGPLVKADIEKKTPLMSKEGDTRPTLPVQSTDGSATVVYDKNELNIAEQYLKVDMDMWYLKDDSVKYIQNEDGEQIEDGLKYPTGRWIYIANKKIRLEDKPCKTKHFPIVPVILDFDPDTDNHGISTIDYIKGNQEAFNEMNSLIHDWLRAVVYPRFNYDPKKGLDPKKVKNKYGAGVPVGPDAFQWWAPPSLPNDVFRYTDEQKNNIEYVSAIQEMSQGRRPASITSAEGLRLLQESSRTVLRPKTRLIEGAVKKLVELIIDYIQIGYSVPKTLRIIGADGAPEQVSLNELQVIDGAINTINDMTIGEYDVYIEPDSTMPKSDIERFDRLIQLAGLGFVDRQALLAVSGLPNWQEIENRIAQREEELKAQEQAMQEQQAQNQQFDQAMQAQQIKKKGAG